MTQETITMTPKELARYEIIKRLLKQEINGTQASKQLGLSVRQTRNLKSRVKQEGLFETLQDRLVKDLRLANISAIDKANQFWLIAPLLRQIKNRFFAIFS